MVDAAPAERRQHQRRTVVVTARLAHDPSGRSFPCQCVDISSGGARLLVPATMPVREGHVVQIEPAEALADQLGGLAVRELAAAVVRVDRDSLLAGGHLTVGVRFQP